MNFFIGSWIATALSMIAATHRYSIKLNTFQHNFTKKRVWINTIIFALPMFLFAALRYGVGVDYVGYEKRFYNGSYKNMPLSYKALCSIVRHFEGSFQIVVFVMSAILIFVVFHNIVLRSPNYILSIYLFLTINFYFETMNVMRQGAAIAICMQSVNYIREKRILPFAVCIAIAASFHTSAAIFAVVFVAAYLRIEPIIQLAAVIAIDLMSSLFANFARYLSTVLGYQFYYLSIYFRPEESYVALSIYNYFTLLLFITIYYYCLRVKKPSRDDANISTLEIFIFIQSLSTCVIRLGGLIPECHRVMYYFQWQSIISIPLFIDQLRGKKEKSLKYLLTFGIVVIFGIYFIWLNTMSGYTSLEYSLCLFR